ncbi:NACHT domain-containing protein [Azohydromonas aeria]|uniref:NACHT domain-containing protein n=1 Tax=Azohydromonas aeria TaxID=2590212 RepID=UPI0012FA4803|nr:hypothetical protein [Azohydromonas aeria]
MATRLVGSQALERVLEKADSVALTRIRNTPAMNKSRLRDFAPAMFVSELEEALAAKNSALIASLASTAGGFRHLPPKVVTSVIAALEKGDLPDQARRELFSMLLEHEAEDAKPVESDLRRWMATSSTDETAVERRNFARTMLLRIGAKLQEIDVKTALTSSDLAANKAAVQYLHGPHGTPEMVGRLVDDLARLLTGERRLPEWIAVHDLLRNKAPKFIETLYANTAASALPKTWSQAELAAEWVKRAPPSTIAAVSAFPLDLYDQTVNGLADCKALRYRMAVLTARAQTSQPTLAEFWKNIVSNAHDCREPFAAPVDLYLEQASKVEDIQSMLTDLFRRTGIQQLADWKLRSTQISQHLSNELGVRLGARDWKAAKQLLLAGVRPSATQLEQIGFWNTAKPSQDGLDFELYFRVLQAAGAGPQAVLDRAAQVATDEGVDPVSRAFALIALASADQLAAKQDVFNAALADHQVVTRTALVLLGRAYDANLPKSAFKRPDSAALPDILTRNDLQGTGAAWLARLVRYDPEFARLQAEQAKWSDAPSASCFQMAPGRPLAASIGINIMDADPDSSTTDVLRACVGLLYPSKEPVAVLARQWNAQSFTHPSEVLRSLKSLREDQAFKSAGNGLRSKMAALVASAGTELPYDLESQRALSWWEEALDKEDPGAASRLRTEWRKRLLITILVAVPGAVFAHLGLWAILLLAYPKSPTLQALVFWNPFVRKMLGLGYVDLLLLYVPFARHRLFAPFAPEFLRDVYESNGLVSQSQGYFTESHVHHRPAHVGVIEKKDLTVLPITSALARHKGRVLLLGKSGLGKSSFLRFCLDKRARHNHDVVVYLRADQCRGGVEAEITRRMKSVGSDQNLLQSVIYAGRMWVYIDGYNEVDLTTQDAITAFVGNYPHGNILVASQISLRGFTGIETFELLPLDKDQIREFLVSRAEILPDSSFVREEAFKRAAVAFLEDIWAKSTSPEEAQAFEEILANPMDLTSVAVLLSQGGVPDLFALEKQQFDAVVRALHTQEITFRSLAFSRAVLKQRLEDQEDLGQLPFKPEVAELIRAKLAHVRTFSDPSGNATAQEIRFRHDRIRDFFTHFSLLDTTPEEQATLAKDARFAGVFPYLARSMPIADAEALRENLITLAAHIEDHRVSDSFIREYNWRQRFAPRDPDWMLIYDLPSAKLAEGKYEELAKAEFKVREQMQVLRDEISSARKLTRILTAADPTELVELAGQILIEMGAVDSRIAASTGKHLISPDGRDFLLVALTQPDLIRRFHVELLAARLQMEMLPILVVANWQVAVAPQERAAILDENLVAALRGCQASVLTSVDLYDAYQAARTVDDSGRIWTHVSAGWHSDAKLSSMTGKETV